MKKMIILALFGALLMGCNHNNNSDSSNSLTSESSSNRIESVSPSNSSSSFSTPENSSSLKESMESDVVLPPVDLD